MDTNCLDQICFDLQLDDQMLDEMSQMYVQHNSASDLNTSATIDSYVNNNQSFNETNPKNSDPMVLQTHSSNYYSENNYNSAEKASNVSQTNNEYMVDIEKCKLKLNSKTDDYCMKIIRDMNSIGVCIIDNFMEDFGELILQEVIYLYQTVVFSDGKVVNNNIVSDLDNDKIRGDSIYWVNGSEPNCKFISLLMTTLDRIVFKCNKMNNNGLMGINSISSRTSAMLACYPGQNSRYKQHADNSTSDGRYITCIYYINKNWEPIRDGGLLRMYPSQVPNIQPLNISPDFDRLICFWSDRRNLHEVLPTKRLRFALTLWYFEDSERKRFRERMRSESYQ